MKPGGWHRLWIVVCVIYLVLVGIFVILEWPRPEKIWHRAEFYQELTLESRKKIILSDEGQESESSKRAIRVEMPNGHMIPFSGEFAKEELEKVAAEDWGLVKKRATQEKGELLFYAGLWWLIPCLVVYALGWAIGWVYRGSRRP